MAESIKEKLKLYLWLMGTTLFISTFTLGGGYVIVPMIKKYYVQRKKFFTEDEFLEIAAVAQSSPGAIAVNAISVVGYKVAGIPGIIINSICSVIPSILILSIISAFYKVFIANVIVAAVLKGMQAGVAALIVDFVVDMTARILKERSIVLSSLIVLSFLIGFFTTINVIFVLLGSCAICVLYVFVKTRRKK